MPHIAFPEGLHGGDDDLVDAVRYDYQSAHVSAKLRALLTIASKVQRGGKHVTTDDVELAAQQARPTKRFTTRF